MKSARQRRWPHASAAHAGLNHTRAFADAANANGLATQLEFNRLKGSLPIRSDIDTSKLDACTRIGVAAMKDASRHVGNGEVYITPDQNGAMTDVLTAYWNTGMPVEKAQKGIAAALQN